MNTDSYLEQDAGDELRSPTTGQTEAPTMNGTEKLQEAELLLDSIAVSTAPARIKKAALTAMQSIGTILEHQRRENIKSRRAAIAPPKSAK